MYLPFEELSIDSRVWIYVAARTLTQPEIESASQILNSFITNWETHGAPMKASYQWTANRILVIAADESHLAASGCSIDKQVRIIQDLEKHLSTSLLDKQQVYFTSDTGLIGYPIGQLKTLIAQGEITSKSLTVNTLTPNLSAWKNEGITAAEQTWLKRYF